MTEVDELINSLRMTDVAPDVFEGHCPSFGWKRIFGGQLLAQGLSAAQRTVAGDRFVHSLHAYFHNAGDVVTPVRYKVERTRDGKRFNARRIVGEQNGKLLITMETSFHVDEGGPTHQNTMRVDLPLPSSLPEPATFLEIRSQNAAPATLDLWRQRTPFEVRPVVLEHYVSRVPRPAEQQVWIRPKWCKSLDRMQNAAILSYLSDMTLLGVTTFAHGCALTDPVVQSSSLSHAMWFHRPCELDGWILYSQDSPSTQNALGLARGSIYAPDGSLIATIAQEGLLRFLQPPGSSP